MRFGGGLCWVFIDDILVYSPPRFGGAQGAFAVSSKEIEREPVIRKGRSLNALSGWSKSNI
jgi:hypothetical protein